MAQIRLLETIDEASLKRFIRGYVSHEKYKITWEESDSRVSFILELIPLDPPYEKVFEVEDTEYYQSILPKGFSLAAYEGEEMAGLVLASEQSWNQTLWIHEFHVLESFQGKGIGRQLMDAVAEKAKAANLRIMLCETQNTNVPAIRFYRKLGFHLDALNLSLYSNADYPDGEIALFMKRKID
jgi:ribosomal protein S18 acetylase RimI-like enzyme